MTTTSVQSGTITESDPIGVPAQQFPLHTGQLGSLACSVRNRLAVALACGFIAALLMLVRLRASGSYAFALDFTPHWRAADALLRGFSPYKVENAFTTLYPFSAGYLYWLPAAIIFEPFGALDPQTATALFAGVSVAVFAYALTVDGWWRLPLLLSAPAVYAARSGQTSPLLVAAMLLPSLGWLAPIKFTLGAAGFAYNLSVRYALLAAGVVVASVAAYPWWPLEWVHELSDVAGTFYHVPVLLPGGFLLLAALIRWRRPEARLLAAMACIPQTMFYYDQLPLALVARSYRQALAFAVLSWVPVAVSLIHFGGGAERAHLFAWLAPLIVACYYVPCLAVVLSRPNVASSSATMAELTASATRSSSLGSKPAPLSHKI